MSYCKNRGPRGGLLNQNNADHVLFLTVHHGTTTTDRQLRGTTGRPAEKVKGCYSRFTRERYSEHQHIFESESSRSCRMFTPPLHTACKIVSLWTSKNADNCPHSYKYSSEFREGSRRIFRGNSSSPDSAAELHNVDTSPH